MQENIALFDYISGLFQEREGLNEPLKTSITQRLQSLQTELTQYFPKLKENQASLAHEFVFCRVGCY